MSEPTIGSVVAKKVFSELFSALAKSILLGAGRHAYAVLTSKGTSFESHIKATFDRCTKIKTLLNRDEPVELLNLYVNLKFASAGKVLDDYDVILQIPDRKRVVISGTGGGGKTIFMRYLWLALFENPRGKIPVFVELRRLNDVTTDKLDLYIYHSIVESQSILSKIDFDEGVREGRFVFVLDGFDEILSEKRNSLERQILSLAHNNPNLTIIVSSRHDERLTAWQEFSVFHVLPLEKKQVIELVQKLRYDKTIAKKFIERIRKDLYSKHKSFLSNPLLATMMLLTFDQFADIPEKMHLFYEQAFDTLFAKHDATKEAYKRKMYANLSIDVFKRYLSYFCLATYYDEKFELSETETLNYLAKCLKIENGSADPGDFLKDLVESVCTLQRDGLNFTFTHRSFQEFFAAYCLAYVTTQHLDDILIKMAKRPTDSVIMMLYDMKRELVEDNFLLPRLRNLKEEIAALPTDERFIIGYSRLMNSQIVIMVDNVVRPRRSLTITHERESEFAYLMNLVEGLYPEYFSLSQKEIRAFKRRDERVLRANISKEIQGARSCQISVRVGDSDDEFVLCDAEGIESDKLPVDYAWLGTSGYERWCRQEAASVPIILNKIEQQQVHKEKAFDSLLRIHSR